MNPTHGPASFPWYAPGSTEPAYHAAARGRELASALARRHFPAVKQRRGDVSPSPFNRERATTRLSTLHQPAGTDNAVPQHSPLLAD